MSIIQKIFPTKPFTNADTREVHLLLDELVRIGIKEDYLSEFPGRGYNAQCRHIRTREIGQRFHEIGGDALMSWSYDKVRKAAGKVAASHLEFAWSEIGTWQP
ncbi:MAG: hypothetical protein KBD67_06455 [Anaerolineaceae bacterium]|nr:hypothetical protein [Anaerolineaceae bacterium]